MQLPRTLRGRVALASAACVAISGGLVATSVVLLSERMARAQEDSHLRDAAGVLAFELRTKDEDPGLIAEDEVHELAQTGISIAVFAGVRRLGGNLELKPQAAGTCEDQGSLRACAIGVRTFTVVTGRNATALRDHSHATLAAALIGVTLATLLGAAASLLLARAAVQPLERLRSRVEQVPLDDPGSADLGPILQVAEVDALRDSLAAAFSRLGAALLQAQRFARDAAHQLRTPLTAILGELDLAVERAPEETQSELRRAQRVARRLANLIDRLLILTRTDARIEILERIDLLEVIEDAIDTLPHEARARVLVAARSTPVNGDPPLLLAMLANALDNSLKFSAGPVKIDVTSSADSITIGVEDEGPGIAADERERVFAPFYRTRASRASDVPGHGIGLALIAHVIQLHGGRARFVERSEGARLELVLSST